MIDYDPLRNLGEQRAPILRPSPDPDVKYELTPGAAGYAWGADVEINALGYRGRMASAAFSGFRIIILGDSVTFGNYLPVDATYPSQLQEILDASASRYEVLNWGVGGYDVLQEAALLEYRGLSHQPDLVVVGYSLNDVEIASPNLEYIERLQRYNSSRLLSSLRLAWFVVERLDRVRMRSWMAEKNRPEVFAADYAGRLAPIAGDEYELQALMYQVHDRYPSNRYRDAVRIMRLRYAMEWFSRLARRQRVQVVVVILPWLVGTPDDYPHRVAHQIVASEARRAGLDVLEVVNDFLAAGMEKLRINSNDPSHPDRAGHRIIAEKLAAYVRKSELH